jgi:prepilin-type N-terminal cleavage/methylation domain-containing protein
MSTAKRRRRGFTLLEVVVATMIFTVIGFTLLQSVSLGKSSRITVRDIATSNKWTREVHDVMSNELKVSDDDHIQTTQLADGNTQLNCMHRIQVAGLPAWGVYDPSLGDTAEDQNREDWQIQFTVEEVPTLGGGVERALVRHLINEGGEIQTTKILARGLRDGAADPPGFAATKVGEMWVIEVTEEGRTNEQAGKGTSFHVKTRN